jgi:hypothetical protein
LLIIIHEFYIFLTSWYLPLIVSDSAIVAQLPNAYFVLVATPPKFFFEICSRLLSTFKISFVTTANSPNFFVDFFLLLQSLFVDFFSFFSVFTVFFSLITNSAHSLLSTVINLLNEKLFVAAVLRLTSSPLLIYNSGYFADNELTTQLKYDNEESAAAVRGLRFNNPLFKYDYKVGDYFPRINKELYLYMFSTLADITGGVRAAPWFLSTVSYEYLTLNFTNFFANASIINTTTRCDAHR